MKQNKKILKGGIIMFTEFDKMVIEEQNKFNRMVKETLEKDRKEKIDEFDKLVNESIEDSNKKTKETLLKMGFSEEKISQMMK